MTSGTDPAQHSCSQTVTLRDGQVIVINWDYQSLGTLQVDDRQWRCRGSNSGHPG